MNIYGLEMRGKEEKDGVIIWPPNDRKDEKDGVIILPPNERKRRKRWW